MGESPDLAGFVTGQLQHLIQGQPLLDRVGNELPLAISCNPIRLCARPQFAAVGAIERVKAISQNSRCIAAIEYGKVHAVEANQTIHGRKPQIAIRNLAGITGNVLRQAVIGGPVVSLILCPGNRCR